MDITENEIVIMVSKAAIVALKNWPEINQSNDPAEILLVIQNLMNRMMLARTAPDEIESTAVRILALHILGCLVSQERLRREAFALK